MRLTVSETLSFLPRLMGEGAQRAGEVERDLGGRARLFKQSLSHHLESKKDYVIAQGGIPLKPVDLLHNIIQGGP